MLTWSISDAVFVTEIDDEHKEIFDALADFEKILAGDGRPAELRKAVERLTTRMVDHFAHEERLMRAARYESLPWHKKLHMAARWRVEGLSTRMEQGDAEAGAELVEYLASWLHTHTQVADRMMGAALRNHRRCTWKVTFRAGTKPLEACDWVTVDGEPLRPPTESAS
ncbi:MAG: hemerythrin family protein [Candidatus Solibacter usitatus]|nr:hemerythrin family protein [Candidatus Solibacter usitatus]